MSVWDLIWESLGSDPDDELAGFAGEMRPKPWRWHDPIPRGHRRMDASARLHDGSDVRLVADHGDGSFDAIVYARTGTYHDVLRSSEFTLTGAVRYDPRRRR